MNKQRAVIYRMRRDVLEDKDVSEQLREMFEDVIYATLDEYAPKDVSSEEWDLEGLLKRLRTLFSFDFDIEKSETGTSDAIGASFIEQVDAEYAQRETVLGNDLRESFKQQVGGDDSKIDFAKLARKRTHDLEKMALLNAVDSKWIDHLYSMDYLRESVRLRALGQRDPLLEYKQESYEMFQQLLLNIYETTVQTLFRVTDPDIRRRRQITVTREQTEPDPFAQLSRYQYIAAEKEQDRSFAAFDRSRFAFSAEAAERAEGGGSVQTMERPEPKPQVKTVRRATPKIGPNDPCTCGSGKKYKKCCGATTS
jgi:preprotein translocase subunit SecA